MKILVIGIGGRMGRTVAELAKTGVRGVTAVFGVDPTGGPADVATFRRLEDVDDDVDCLIDFSHHSAINELLAYAESERLPMVIATTGHTPEEERAIAEAAKVLPIFKTANLSLGIALLKKIACITAQIMPEAEIEIVETHHDRKQDAPSGTALMLAEAIRAVRPECYPVCGRSGMGKRAKEEIGIHAVRIGNVVGQHEVLIGTDNQTISLKHTAHDRALFAEGALAAAEYIIHQPAGLYNMDDLTKDIK